MIRKVTKNNKIQIHHNNNEKWQHFEDEAWQHLSHANNTIAIILPPPVVETVISSSQSLTSSIGIGEFSMNPAPRGSAVVFCGCERPLVFKTEVSKGHKRSTFGLKHGCHIHLWVLACLLWCI
jgi:hypothetical protein